MREDHDVIKGSFLQALRLRPAQESDALCVHALATQVFLDTYATSGIRPALAREVEANFSMAAVRARLDESSLRITLAEHQGHMIGFAEVGLGARHPLVADPRSAEITRLYVQSPFLRRGVGKRLLAHSEALALSEGASTLWLTSWVGNTRALAFYESQGYKRLGSTDHVFEGEAIENRLFAKVLGDGA